MKILFLCRGNVGRSQIAEALMKKMAKESGLDVEVISAGTKLSGPEQPIGELTPGITEVIDVMKEEGMDISGYIRKSVTEDMAASADKIVLVVDERDPIPDYLTDNPKAVTWDVLDPKGQDLAFTRNVRDQIKTYIQTLIKGLLHV